MIRFPETAQTEWQIAEDAANAEVRLRVRIARDTLVERKTEELIIAHEARAAADALIASENAPVLEMFTLADYKADPAGHGPGDLIEGAVRDEGLTLMLGPSQSGKSTLALQGLYCLMTGEDFLGQKVHKIDGSVGILSYDMSGGLMAEWMVGFPNIDERRISIVNAYKQANPLAIPEHRATIAEAWRARGVDVVLIDSFSASFFGKDQNSASESMAHYRDLKQFAMSECGARAVIVIVHSSRDSPKKPRGSTVHEDVADAIVAVWMPEGRTGPRQVEMVKYRQHRGSNGAMTEEMAPVVITKPDDVTHLVALDPGAMTMAGLSLPPSVTAEMFADEPEPYEAPDTSPDPEEDE